MPAIVFLFAGTKNFCPGTRMARSYNTYNHTKGTASIVRQLQSSRMGTVLPSKIASTVATILGG